MNKDTWLLRLLLFHFLFELILVQLLLYTHHELYLLPPLLLLLLPLQPHLLLQLLFHFDLVVLVSLLGLLLLLVVLVHIVLHNPVPVIIIQSHHCWRPLRRLVPPPSIHIVAAA